MKISITLIVIIYMMCPAETLWAEEYNWNDFTKPYTTKVNVRINKGSTVCVDLPEDYLQNNIYVKLHIDLQSNFTYMIDGLKQKGFEGFSPKISINGGIIRGNYTIQVKKTPLRQTVPVDIKTKYLRTGKNELRFHVGKENNVKYSCKGGNECVVFFVREISFDVIKSTKSLEKKNTLTFPDKANIWGSFEDDSAKLLGWNLGKVLQERTGEGGFQKVYIDRRQGVKNSHRCLAMDFRLGPMRPGLSESHRLPVAILRNDGRRNLLDYQGIKFYIWASKKVVITFGVADKENGTNKEERWNRNIVVTPEKKSNRIPFNSLSLFKRRALSQGTNQILDLNRVEAIYWVAHGRNVPFGTEVSIYLDKISFY